MKPTTQLTGLKALAMSVAIGAFALAAAGQPTPDRPRRPLPEPDSPLDERPQFPRFRPGFGVEGVLNEQQRAELREIFRANRERHQELERKIREARRDLDEAIFAEKFNEKTIRKKADAIAALEAERITLRAKAFGKLRPSLTPEQIERIKRRRAELGPGFFGPGVGGPGVPRRFLEREDRFRELEGRPPREHFDRPEPFRPEVRPEHSRPPRPEARWHDPRPERPERRFSEPEYPEGETDRPRFRGHDFERDQPEFRREERRPLRPEARGDGFERRRELGPRPGEERRAEPRLEEDAPRPRKRPEPPPEPEPQNREREPGGSSPPADSTSR